MRLRPPAAFVATLVAAIGALDQLGAQTVSPTGFDQAAASIRVASTDCHSTDDEPSRCAGREAECDLEDVGCAPRWTATAEAIFLQRQTPHAAALMFNPADPAQNLNAAAFEFGFQPGVELSLERRFAGGNGCEVRYLGVDPWKAPASTATPFPLLQVNSAPPVFTPAGTRIDAGCRSDLHSFELNAKHACGEWLTMLGGFRYAELEEQFTATLIDPPIPFLYDTRTHNRLYGVQCGADALLWDCGGPLTIDVIGKAGIYGNRASHDSFYSTGVVTLPAGDKASSTAFLGEMSLAAAYRLTARVSLTGGYRLLWIDGVALATDQVAVSDFVLSRGISTGGDAFYHGGFVGLQYAR